MTDRTELKRLAEAFPADLDWDSNTEPFFNGPSGESLGGGSTGFYSVYGKPFRLEGEDYDYDGPTYVQACNADFAKFMVAARDGVLALIAENDVLTKIFNDAPDLPDTDVEWLEKTRALEGERDQIRVEVAGLRTGYEAYERVNAELKAENEALRKDAERYRMVRGIASISASRSNLVVKQRPVNGFSSSTARDFDASIDAAMGKGNQS